MELDGKYSKDQSLKCECLLFGTYTQYSLLSSLQNARGHQPIAQTTDQINSSFCLSPLLDLDDTLYPFNSGIAADIKKNIQGSTRTHTP